jgi:hypothetical protein
MADGPREQLFALTAGFMVTKAIGTAVQLGIPELVSERPRPAAELAAASGADPDAVTRLLRTLASVGVFADRDGVIEHTPMSEFLVRGVPGSFAAQSLLLSHIHFASWGDALETFRTGESAFERVNGEPFFDWLSWHPDEAATFTEAMAGGANVRRETLLARDWSGVSTVVDVGGADGTALVALLQQQPQLTGTVFDLPHVRADAERTIGRADVGDCCQFVPGSFFDDVVPAGADVYVLSRILHDWDDASAAVILRSVRAAMTPSSRLVLVEAVIAPGNEPDVAKLMDLHMLVALGGRERSEDQWRELLASTGFGPPQLSPGLVEADPV